MTVRFEPTRAIDVAALFDGGDAATDRALAEALERHGGAVVAGFAGSGDLDGRMDRALAFFRMEEEAKLACAVRSYAPDRVNLYRGYYPRWENPGSAGNEIFDIGPEPPMASPDVPGAGALREANAWPDRDPVPGWRDAMLDLQRFLRDLAVTLRARSPAAWTCPRRGFWRRRAAATPRCASSITSSPGRTAPAGTKPGTSATDAGRSPRRTSTRASCRRSGRTAPAAFSCGGPTARGARRRSSPAASRSTAAI